MAQAESCKNKLTIKQGDSDSDFIISLGTKFKLSVDLTVIESYKGLGFT